MKIKFYFFAFIFLTVFCANAQAPANDACAGAQVITPNGSCNPGTTVGSADNWVGTVGCQSANHVEVWYSFTATGSQLSVSVTPGTIGGTIEFILVQATSACSGLTIVGSLCGSSPLTGTINGLQAGSLYYYTISSTGATGTFTSCVNNTTPPPVAGQDCASAAILCSSATFSQSTSAAGFGTQEVSTSNSCWGSGGERQSKWFKFTVGCSGTLEFNINPVVSSNDYDWALWNVTTAGCPTTASAVPTSIACNWSGCKGSTGMSSCATSEPGVNTGGSGCFGGPAAWTAPITVTAGQTYALLVDNFSTSNSGFNLIFGGACNGGTALIGPSAAFTFTSPSCGAFNFTKSCQTSNSTFLWSFGDGTTSALQNPSHTYTTSGTYIVSLQVTDALGCTVQTSQTIVVGIPTSNAGPDLTLCSAATGTIGAATTAGYTYSWSPSTGLSSTTVSNPSVTLTNTGTVATVAVYTVTTSASGCTSTDAVSVTVNPSPTVTAGPTQSLTCSNTSTVLAGTTSGGTITWSGPGITGGGSTTTPTVNAIGVYTISVTSGGCTSAATVSVGQNTIAPTVTATASNSLNCTVTTASVIASTTTSPASYVWTGTGITGGAGTASASVNAGGTFNYTVTNTANGCNTTGSVAVVQNTTAPTVVAAASSSLNCQVTSTTVVASTTASPVSYTWTGTGITGGSGTASATVNAGGTYNYTVTNTSNGCLTAGSVSVIQNTTAPTASAVANGSINCTTATAQAVASTTSSPVSYTWSGSGIVSGANTASATVNAGGNYIYTVTNTFNQCITTGTVTIIQSAGVPSVTASSGSLNCNVTSTTVVASTTASPVSYTWTGPGITGGANTATATINLGGNYIYTVTNTSNSCTATGTVTVVQNTTAPVVNATASSSLNCQVTSTTVVASTTASPVSYTWTGTGITGGSGTASATVNAGGTYNYTVTNTGNGCFTTGSVSVTQNNTVPVVNASASGSINCVTSTVQTIASTTATPVSYTWTGPGITAGATTASATVNAGGTYNYTVNNTFNQCSAVGSVSVTQSIANPTVTAVVNGSLNCLVTSTTIAASTTATPVSYTWTGPGITAGSSAATATVNLGGIYVYTVTNTSNSCTATGTVTVIQNTTAPSPVAATAGTVNCTTNTVTINGGPPGLTYTWTAPAGSSVSSANQATTTATGGGTYSLTVVNPANSCSSFTTLVVPTQTTSPVASISNTPTLNCTNTVVTINGGPASGVTYTWSGPGIVGSASNAAVSASVAGSYSLSVTSTSNGCVSAPVTVSVSQNIATPTITAVSQTGSLVCGVNSTVALSGLSTPAGSTYTWTSSSSSFFVGGVNSPTVAVNSATTYTLLSTHPVSGCISSLVYTVVPDINSPTVTLSPNTDTITCLNTVVSTTATSNPSTVTYTWTGPGIVGSNTLSTISGSLSGTYNLTVTNTNNSCTTVKSFVVSADNTPLTVSAAASNSIDCNTSSSGLTTTVTPSPGTFSYSWSNGASTSTISVSPTITTNYVVTVTNTANGCTGSQTVGVTVDTTPPAGVSVSPNNFTLTCLNSSTVLTGTTTSSGTMTYSWSSSFSGFTDPAISTATVANAGTYSVTVIAPNGCSATAVATISPNTSAPVFTLSNSSPSVTCGPAPTVSITVTSSVPVSSYSWTPSSGIAGSNTSSVVTFTTAGTYTADVIDINGCKTSSIISVGSATAPPVLTAGTDTAQPITCTNTLVTLNPQYTPTSDLTYTWSGNGVNGTSTSSVQVSQSGTYTVVVTNSVTGCSTSTMITVTGSTVVPSLTVTSSSSLGISCQPGTATVNLSAQSNPSTVTYTWSNGINTSTIDVSTAGIYTVSVTENSSGCVATGTINVANNVNTPTINVTSTGNLPCGGGTTSLTAVSSDTNVSYAWSGAGVVSGSASANAAINLPGTYTVTATDAITGCSSSNTIAITQSSVIALAVADVTTGTAPLTVNFTDQSTGATTYTWTFGNGSNSQSQNTSATYNSTGNFTVVLTVSNGACTASDTLMIKVLEALGQIPEIFTPNQDGNNDVFKIEGLESYPNAGLQVFNRWGNPVYTAKPYPNNWDGTPNTAGKTGSGKLPVGTYFYLLELGDANNTVFKGYVQVVY